MSVGGQYQARRGCRRSGAPLTVALATVVLATLAPSSPARAAPPKRVGVLVLASTAGDERVLRRIADTRATKAQLLGPSSVARRVRQASAAELAKARAALARAESASLNMARGAAVSSARAALAAFSSIGGRHVAPKLVARANLALATAQLLHPPDVAAARAAFRAALDADPKLAPDRRRYAPRVLRVLAAARKLARSARLPAAAVLTTVRQRARLDELWLLRGQPGSAGRVVLTLSGGAAASARVEVARAELSSRAAALLHVRLSSSAPAVAATPPTPTSNAATATTARDPAASPTTHPAADVTSPRAQPLPPRPSNPWYRRWWVWTLVGGVVAAAAGVGIGVALAGDDAPPGFDLRLRFPR